MTKFSFSNSLLFFNSFIYFFGFYCVIGFFSLSFPTIPSRLYTIPLWIITLLLALIYVLKYRFRLSVNKSIYTVAFLFFSIYLLRAVYEILFKNAGNNLFLEIPFYFIVCAIVPFIYFSQNKTNKNFELLLNAIYFGGIIFSLICLLFFIKQILANGQFNRDLVPINPLLISYTGSLFVGICMSKLIFDKWVKQHTKFIIGIVLGFIPLLIGGSRGPILVLFLPLLFVLYYKNRFIISKRVFIFIIGFLFFLSIAIYFFGGLAIERLLNIYKDIANNDASVSRLTIWSDAFKMFMESPIFGHSLIMQNGLYPHNLFLEVLMATGIVGFIPFFVLIYFSIIRGLIIFRRNNNLVWVPFFLFQIVLSSLLSFNIYSTFWFWLAVGLIWAVDVNDNTLDNCSANS